MIVLIAMSMFVASQGDPFARARNEITPFCRQTSGNVRACVVTQKQALARFVTIMAGFSDPGHRTALKCMRLGKRGRYIDWPVAKQCMQSAAKGVPIGGTLSS